MYRKVIINNDIWVITEEGRNWKTPQKSLTFAFDTETLLYLDGKIQSQKQIYKKLKDVSEKEKRQRLYSKVWAFQVYDEYNGFFMTNDFNTWLDYICKCSFKYGWCYNSTFDFAQIDYKILAEYKDVWKPHEHKTTKGYNKAQPYTYESIHNDMGSRYAYKLWCPYKQVKDRHTYVHAFELRDFMKLLGGGLKNLLNDLDVRDNEGNKIRKLEMEYQAVNPNNLTQEEISYCCNDVKGLYFAIKQFNKIIEEQTENELHIYGKYTNIMTAGGLAKRELLRSLYEEIKPKYRIEKYQKDHPITKEQDKYFRENYLYRGGIAFVNSKYKGRLITNKLMYRYDVNSEYPYSMANIRDLIGQPQMIKYKDWLKYSNKQEYECIYMLEGITGTLKKNMVGIWYDPKRKDYVDFIEEDYLHLIFERELQEYENWYDLEYKIKTCIIIKRGDYVYKDFINKNYEIKAQAKRDKNKTLQSFAKLLLNSSYGKLAERIERRIGHYELNEENGAIHFIEDMTELDDKSRMSVLVGSLITCFARCYILSKIREICKNNPLKNFVYIDTDSIHCFNDYEKADAYALGGLKLEATCEAIKYLLPKTYIDIEKVENGLVNIDDIELHTKGVPIQVIKAKMKNKKLSLRSISKLINYGAKYIMLMAINVRGGKALIPTEKYLARPELSPNYSIHLNEERTIINER